MITLRQTIITGWLLVLLSVIGAVIGFVLYSKLVIGVSIERQLSSIKFGDAFVIDTETTNIANFRFSGSVPIELPLNAVELPLTLKGTYTANIDIDTRIPIDIDAHFSENILVETNLDVASDIKLVSRWLPRLPVTGVIPIRFELPVGFSVPVRTTMPFKYHGPVTFSVDQTITPNTDHVISTSMQLDHTTQAPIKNHFQVSVNGEQAQIPISFDDVTVQIPLSTIKYAPSK
jgi:hypothetical protein